MEYYLLYQYIIMMNLFLYQIYHFFLYLKVLKDIKHILLKNLMIITISRLDDFNVKTVFVIILALLYQI